MYVFFPLHQGGLKFWIPDSLTVGLSLVPRPVRAIRVTRGGLEPSAKSPRTTRNEAGWDLLCGLQLLVGIPDSTSKDFLDSGFSQGRISQIPEFPYVG